MPPRFPAHTLTTEPALTTAATEAKKLCVGEEGWGRKKRGTFGAHHAGGLPRRPLAATQHACARPATAAATGGEERLAPAQ